MPFINMCIGTLRTGGVSNEVFAFAFLCGLQHFDLRENPRLDQSTLAGHLACTMKNFKDATHIDARNQGLKGEGSAPVLSGFICRVDAFPFLQDNCPRNSENL